MSTEWYYSQGGQQIGPVTSQQLKDLAAGGQVTPNDLVWKDGMPEWTPAARVRGLFPGAGGGVATAAAPQQGYGQPQAYAQPAPGNADYAYAQQAQGGQIGYYSATSDINERTRRILANIPPVTGPRGDWPLSDQHLSQLAAADAHRKPIRAFASMGTALMLLYIAVALIWMVTLIQLSSFRGGFGRRSEPMLYMTLILLASITLAVLHPLAGGAAKRCRAWGPILSTVLHSILALLCVWGLIAAAGERFIEPQVLLILLLSLAFEVLYVVISIRAMAAIPRFLNSPVWCVEAMINARQ